MFDRDITLDFHLRATSPYSLLTFQVVKPNKKPCGNLERKQGVECSKVFTLKGCTLIFDHSAFRRLLTYSLLHIDRKLNLFLISLLRFFNSSESFCKKLDYCIASLV